ncbi:MAG: Ig-like domain-containing protein, partial [Planctomycetes bacterium]|nr:Ig-like domain-containing protein [Planctomycetota bacterium]
MIRVKTARLFSLAILAAVAACSGGGGTTAGIKTGGDFVVLKTEPSDNATLYLNDAIKIDFSKPVNLDSVDLSTFSFRVQDQIGNVVAEPVAGTFQLDASPGDDAVGRRLLFLPKLPTNDLYTNGGFRPGRTYTVQLVGGSRVNGTVLRDADGKGLAEPKSFRFVTADGTTPAQLFRNTLTGGPRRTAFEVSPQGDAGGVWLNKLGTAQLELRLRFDQPLNPSNANVPVSVVTDPSTRNSGNRGRVFLEYDDPILGNNTWIPADVELESNTVLGSSVVLRPLGVLPNNATVRVVVERTLEDISGESNVSNAAYERVFATFKTRRAYEQQFDAIVEDFETTSAADPSAAFAEPTAEVGPGYLKAGFGFEGSNTGAEFEPTTPETILNTNFTLVTPKVGAPYNVSGGVFNFKNVKIPAGKIVKGTGSNPMVWLVSGTFEVEGTLSVRGGDGTLVTTSGNAYLPKAGGAGVCGGGDGGAGSPSATKRDLAGANGNGPLQAAGQGGVGGAMPCVTGCNRAAGGGGGGFATQGDPNFKIKAAAPGTWPVANPTNVFTVFQQQQGIGGNACSGASGAVSRNVQGAAAGSTVFADARNDNNFWGVGVRFDGTPLRITGELAQPMGGGGGGGGGDLSYSTCDTADVNFENDSSGGGGGGGGGVLIVKALGPIIIADGGKILADGGHGGGGEQSGSSNKAGGGGGGAGGMVILMSATRIDINARGTNGRYRYGAPGTSTDTNDFDFSISADGGVSVSGTFGTATVLKKYNGATATPFAIPADWGFNHDSAPRGGFGGMGIVQLMAPPGTNADNTNTILDDNIRVFRAGTLQTGAGKRDLLAWRGFPNLIGQGVDDFNTVITIGDNEGDIRPSPVLLPTPVAAKTRLRSNWIDTGFTARRGLAGDDNLPRGIVEQPGLGIVAGPRYEFAGTTGTTGYAAYSVTGSSALASFPIVIPATDITSVNTNATTQLGEAAYRVNLASAALGTDIDRFVHYEA